MEVFTLITSVLLNLTLSILVYIKAPRSVFRNIFVVFSFSFACMPLSLFLSRNIDYRFITIGIIFTMLGAASFLHFIYVFPDRASDRVNLKHLLIYLPVLIWPVLVRYTSWQALDFGIRRTVNFWYYPFILNVFLYFLAGFLYSGVKYVRSSGVYRKQLQYFIAGFALSFFVITLTNIVMPALFNNSTLIFIGPAFFSAVPLFTAAAIFKYRFMDITVAIKKGFVFSALIAIISLIYIVGISIFSKITTSDRELQIILISTLIAIGLPWLKKLLENVTDAVFFQGRIDYPKEIAVITNGLSEYIDEVQLLNYLVVAVCDRFKLASCSFSIKDRGSVKRFSFSRNQGVVMQERLDSDTLMDLLDNSLFGPVRYLELHALNDTVEIEYKRIYSELERNSIEVVFPVWRDNRLTALFSLGKKLSGEIFYYQETESIRGLVNQLMLAFDKIMLYSEKIEIQRRLTISEKDAAIGELTRKLVHEIKNPLVSLSAFFQIDDNELDKEEIAQFRRLSMESIKRILHLITDLSSFHKLTPKNYEQADINRIIEDQLLFMTPLFKKSCVNYSLSTESLPLLWIDPPIIKQALLNVMQNAVEAMPDGGLITIESRLANSMCEIIIRDKGLGIAPELLPNIFDPLVTTKKTGSGLGLAITSHIISEHGGSIDVFSVQLEGTTFVIKLPVVADKE